MTIQYQKTLLIGFITSILVAELAIASDQRDFSTSDITKVIMLGTGNPLPDPTQSGPGVAVIVNAIPYIVDAGIVLPHGIFDFLNRSVFKDSNGLEF